MNVSASSAGLFGAYFAHFFSGALLCNALPHLVAGLQGHAFPTPFARPRGIGESSAIANFAWGFGNLLAGGWMLINWPLQIGPNTNTLVLALGALLLGLYLSVRFQRMRSARATA